MLRTTARSHCARPPFLIMCLVAAVALPNGTYAQGYANAGPPPPGATVQALRPRNLHSLQEIIITAEKRRQNIEDVPVSVTAISGNELQKQGISSLSDAAMEVPGLAADTAGPAQTTYAIRGVSVATGVATVGFDLDGVPVTPPTDSQFGTPAIDPDLYDIDRVEVLRGPQGTLYGAGSMGGTIKVVTNQPNLDGFALSSKIDSSGTQSGGGFNWGGNGMLNFPIVTGKLAVRLVATDKHTSGWIDRIVLSQFPTESNPQCAPFYGCTQGNVLAAPISAIHSGVNDEQLTGGRVIVRYRATDRLSISGEYLTQVIQMGGLSYFDDPPDTDAHYEPFDIAEPFSDTFHLSTVSVNYGLPAFTVTAISSYWSRNQSQTQDASEAIQSVLDLPSFPIAAGGIGPISGTELDGSREGSEEVRLTSTGDGKFQWLAGGFYSNYRYQQYQFYQGPGIALVLGTGNLFTQTEAKFLKQWAGFGQASYKFTDRLEASVGLRRYSYTQGGPNTQSGAFAPTIEPTTAIPPQAFNAGVSPNFTLSDHALRHLMVYTTISKGFRPGEPNTPVPTSGPGSCTSDLQALGLTQAPAQTNPDTLWSYELGEKGTFFDDRMMLNSDVYYEHWTDIQQAISLACGSGFVGNVGTAEVRGAELEIHANLSSSWMLTQSAAYTHAVITSTAPGTGFLPGERVLGVPNYSAATSLAFTHPFGTYTFVALAQNVLQGSEESLQYNLIDLPGYDLVRGRIGVARNRWSIFLFGDNLANHRALLSDTRNIALNIPSLSRISTNQPRTVGLTFQLYYP